MRLPFTLIPAMKPLKHLCLTLALFAFFLGLRADGAEPARPDWELVRSVSNPYGGVVTHYVLIPEAKQRDVAYYQRTAAQVCGSSDTAMVFFWTDRARIPNSAEIPVDALRVMTAKYERNPSYKQPTLHLAAWLYPTPDAAKQAHCFYAP